MFTLAFAVNVVALVIVTVVFFVVAFAGAFPALFVQFTHVYQSLTVASILTCFPYLYVHAPVTLLIHVHLFNVNA